MRISPRLENAIDFPRLPDESVSFLHVQPLFLFSFSTVTLYLLTINLEDPNLTSFNAHVRAEWKCHKIYKVRVDTDRLIFFPI